MQYMKIKENVTRYEDYKYVMQDAGNIYIGARYSYAELLEQEMVPFKLKTILTRYVLTEISPETTLESQFYYIEENTFLYETYRQLKVQIKTQIQKEKKTISGRTRIEYKEKIFTLQELARMNLAQKKASGMIVREIIVSKLGMMVFSV